MRNLKKILALVLALVMSFSIMTISSAAFNDQDKIDETYAEAIDVLSALKVFEGYENGNFDPKGQITRAEVAAIIYRVTTGDVDDRQAAMYADMNAFTDVKADDWFAGYVNYCASAQYIKGRGDGTFDPQGKVIGFDALTMILRAIGYDKNDEFTGPSYTVEVAKVANQRNITRNLKDVTLGVAATREVVAEILFQTIMVPQVSYTLALGYSIYDDVLRNQLNDSLAHENFGLHRISGVIDSVTRGAGVTVIKSVQPDNNNNTVEKTYQVNNAENSWENIGYAAHIYGVETAKPDVYNALTKTYMDGQSLAVTTDGTPFWYLGGILDGTYRVYLNGVLMSDSQNVYFHSDYDFDGDGFKNDESDADYVLYGLTPGHVGVKVDYVDNDGAGKADAIVVTHYTVAEVTGVAHSYNSGTSAVKKDHYYLTGLDGLGQYTIKNAYGIYPDTINTASYTDRAVAPYHVDDIICDEALLKGELVTYVDYKGEAYITKTTSATGVLTKIDRSLVDYSDDYNQVYTVGDAQYITANDYHFDAKVLNDPTLNVLTRAYLSSTVVLALDPYGYVLNSEVYDAPDSYLYVYENDQTKGLGTNRLTETRVVFADGTSADVMVAGTYTEAGRLIDNFFDATYDYDNLGNEIYDDDSMPNKVYTYRVVDGVYYLYETSDFEYVSAASYTAGRALFGQFKYDAVTNSNIVYETGLNNKSILVDVRPGWLGNVYVGHSGENRVPSLVNFGAWVKLDDNGNDLVECGFLVNGNATGTTYYKEFIAFHTYAHSVTRDVYGNRIYHVDVIDLTTGTATLTEIELDEAEYNDLDTYGVGRYQYYGSSFEYTAFTEEWLEIHWGWDTLAFDRDNDGKNDVFVEYGQVPFYVLNIEEGEAHLYTMEDGFDGTSIFGNSKAYVNFTTDNRGNPVVLEIYIIDGVVAHPNNDPVTTVYHDKVTGYDNDGNPNEWATFVYWVSDGYVTNYLGYNDATALMLSIAAYETALAAYNEAVEALEDYLQNGSDDPDVTLDGLYEAVQNAKADLDAAAVDMRTELDNAGANVTEGVKDLVEGYEEELATEIADAHSDLLSDANEEAESVLRDNAIDFQADLNNDLTEVTVIYSVDDDAAAIEAKVIAAVKDEVMKLDAFDAYKAEGADADDVTVEFVGDVDLTKETTVTVKVTVTVAGTTREFTTTVTVNATEGA